MPQILAGAAGGAQEGVQGLLKPMQEQEEYKRKQALLLQMYAQKQALKENPLEAKVNYVMGLTPGAEFTPEQKQKLALALSGFQQKQGGGFGDFSRIPTPKQQKEKKPDIGGAIGRVVALKQYQEDLKNGLKPKKPINIPTENDFLIYQQEEEKKKGAKYLNEQVKGKSEMEKLMEDVIR